MNNQITAVVVDDQRILLDGRKIAGMDGLANALKSELDSNPDFIRVIESTSSGH